jgi:hypothetical protein
VVAKLPLRLQLQSHISLAAVGLLLLVSTSRAAAIASSTVIRRPLTVEDVQMSGVTAALARATLQSMSA